jgi:hypothetical protein
MLPSSVASNLPAMVRNELSQMSAVNQEAFLEDYKRKQKSTAVAYILFFFFVGIGSWHYGYLGRWGKQFLYWFTAGGFGIWALIDLFKMSGLVDNYNKDVATDVMRNLKAIGTR